MTIKPIRNDEDLQAAFNRFEAVYQSPLGTPEAYENKHYPITPPEPVDAIRFRMEQQELTAKDLEPFIGKSERVSEVLNRKRKLSISMIKHLHDGLHIPYESPLA